MFAVFENVELPTSSLPTESGSGNCLGNFYRLWPENSYLGSSTGADTNFLSECKRARQNS